MINQYDSLDDAERVRIEDAIYSASKFGLNFIPVAGPFLSELLGFMFANPIENRRNIFFTDLNAKLEYLAENGSVNYETLKNDQDFINIVLNAVPMALRAFEQEKRDAFRNVILNVAVGEKPDVTRSQIFIQQLSILTVAHIEILYFIDDPRKWFRENKRAEPNTYMGSLSSALNDAYPKLEGHEDLVNILWADLKNAGFHNSGDLKTMMTGDGILSPRTSQMGKEFIKFIQFNHD